MKHPIPPPEPTATELAVRSQNLAIRHLESALQAIEAMNRAISRRADTTPLKARGQTLQRLREAITPPRVVTVKKETSDTSALPPSSFLEAYSLLTDKVYGPFITTFQDDTAVSIRASRWRIDGKDEVRGGAKFQKKKLSQTTRHVVLDLKAYEHKKRIDMKLRRIAKECLDVAHGITPETELPLTCPSCGKIQLNEWRFCPRCGDNLTAAKGGNQ